MAQRDTAQDVQPDTNGHLPPGMTWTKVLDVLVGSNDHQIFVNGLGMAMAESGNQCIFQPNIQQRCAQVRCLAPALYHGQVLELISASLPQRWRDWDRTIDTLCLAMAELDMQPLSEVNPEEIVWLWDPYIPLKKLTLVEGDPSSGKTYLLLAIAAAVTAAMPCPIKMAKSHHPRQTSMAMSSTLRQKMALPIRYALGLRRSAQTSRAYLSREIPNRFHWLTLPSSAMPCGGIPRASWCSIPCRRFLVATSICTAPTRYAHL